MEIGNVVQLIDKVMKGASGEAKTSDLRVGDLIKATVLSIDRSNMLLDLGAGKKLMATDQSKINYNIGDKVEFEVTDKKGETIVLKNNLSNYEILESKLKGTGINIKSSTDIKEGVKLLVENEVPLTQENLKGLEAKKGLNILSNLIRDNILVDEDSLSNNKEQVIKSELQEGIKTLIKAETPEGKDINSIKNFESLDKMLGDFGIKDLVFMIKNNVPLNLSNIISHANLIQGKNNMSEQIINLDKAIDSTLKMIEDSDKSTEEKGVSKKPTSNLDNKNIKSALTEIKDEILKFKMNIKDGSDKDVKKDIDQFKELLSKIEEVKKEFNIPLNSDLSKALDDIKMSVDFMNSFDETTAYMQIPISSNGEFKNMELFISQNTKNSNKIDENNCNIYISLDTFNLGRINTLIEIKKQSVDLSFSTDDEKVKRILKTKEKVISERIVDLGLDVGMIRYRIDDKSLVEKDLVSNEKLNNIDIRV